MSKYPGEDAFFKKFEALMRDDKMRAAIKKEAIMSKYKGLVPVQPGAKDDEKFLKEFEEAAADFKKGPWHPVERRMGMFKREEKGIYTDEGTPGLFYFKATHWRYIK